MTCGKCKEYEGGGICKIFGKVAVLEPRKCRHFAGKRIRPRYTRRHYNEIAKLVHDFTWGDSNKLLSEKLADVFEKDNPLFNRTKWYEASRHAHFTDDEGEMRV